MRLFKHPLWISAVLLGLLALAGTLSAGSQITSALALITLFYEAWWFGQHWLKEHGDATRWVFGCSGIIAACCLIQTTWYYLGGLLSAQIDIMSLITSLLVLHGLTTLCIPAAEPTDAPQPKQPSSLAWVWTMFLIACALACDGILVLQAHRHVAMTPILTPWARMPVGTFAVYAFLAVVSWLASKRTPRLTPMIVITSLSLASITFLTAVLYPLGFGFDGFLHRASELVMLQSGTLQPKPFYYIGQYTLITWLSRWFHLSIHSLDVLLLPLGALLLPLAIALGFHRNEKRAHGLLGCILLLPLSAFITTTPQSFSYLLGLLALCLALGQEDVRHALIPSLCLAAWSVTTHPLAGLPFFGAVCCVLFTKTRLFISHKKIARAVTVFVAIGTIVSAPIGLAINSLVSSAHIIWDFHKLAEVGTYAQLLTHSLTPEHVHVALWADWATWVSFLLPLTSIALAVYAIIKDKQDRVRWQLLTGIGLGCIIIGALLNTVSDFTFLISYERSSYADRMLTIGALLVFLPALHGFAYVVERMEKRQTLSIISFVIIFAAMQAGHVYASFPRNDAIVVGHGWSSGVSDRDAVRFIDEDAQGKPYTVLADQQVSAMAIDQFGFKRYAGDVFFYPVPTGGPLYQLYLTMMQQPTRETVGAAAALGQSSLVYVVLNDYWWNADAVAEELAAIADQHHILNNGQVRVYRFDLTNVKKR